MVDPERRSLTILVLVAIAALQACDRAPARSPARVTTTSASVPPAARPSSSRTVDSTGFTDNAGRSSNETARTEMSGMRATEGGFERPTGTPGTGFPLPIGRPPRPPAHEKARPGIEEPMPLGGTPAWVIVGRIAEARCDVEGSCGRIAEKGSWATRAECIDEIRLTTRDDLRDEECVYGFDDAAVTRCLSTIRLSACDTGIERLDSVPECAPSEMCGRR
jgi:hypothetical protein